LRGIQHEEMESILQFMYLGVATLHQDNIDGFLNVAKNLEIKEIGKDFQINDICVGDDKLYSAVYESEVEKDDKEITDGNTSDNVMKQNLSIDKAWDSSIPVQGPFDCDYCDMQFMIKTKLDSHRSRRHTAVDKYCSLCDYTTKRPNELKLHIQSKHEGVKYDCNQCDHQSSSKNHLKKHIQSKHEGVKYSCNHCNFQSPYRSYLKIHIESIHYGVKYSCNFCDHQFTRQNSLKLHIVSKHKGQ